MILWARSSPDLHMSSQPWISAKTTAVLILRNTTQTCLRPRTVHGLLPRLSDITALCCVRHVATNLLAVHPQACRIVNGMMRENQMYPHGKRCLQLTAGTAEAANHRNSQCWLRPWPHSLCRATGGRRTVLHPTPHFTA